MQIIYIGDANKLLNRIKSNHCSGNVEGSALRQHIALAMGYKLKRTKRNSGSTRIRIDSQEPHQDEKRVSDYIRNGKWRIILLDNYKTANDFQWFAIEKLCPLLNRKRKDYGQAYINLYTSFLQKLKNSPLLDYENICSIKSAPGVYIFYHSSNPKEHE